MNSKVKNDNFIVIQGFMVNDLKLKGNELLIYAIINGFSQEDGQVFNGSLQYLAEWTNSTKQGVIKNIKSLIDKGYLGKNEKYINGVKFCEYYATKLNTPLNKVEYPMQQSLTGGDKQSLPNNIDCDIDTDKQEQNIVVGRTRFIPPLLDEIKAYCMERGNTVDAERFYNYYTANGWKVGKNTMKDWKATVRYWERADNGRGTKQTQSGGVLDDYNRYNEILGGGIFEE